jgi:C4-dicarboxylate transporter DctM subunit
MLWNQQLNTVVLGWDFYAPVILFVVLCALAMPVWAAIGSAAIMMLDHVRCAAALSGRRIPV